MQVVEAYPDTGRRVFQTVLTEFEKFLEHYFKNENDATRKGVSLAQQVEQRETLAIQYTIELRKMLSEVPVQDGVRDFLFHVWADVLAVTAVRVGAQADVTKTMKRAAADLIWSASSKASREERAEVIRRLPPLLATLRQGMNSVGMAQQRQEDAIKALNIALTAAFGANGALVVGVGLVNASVREIGFHPTLVDDRTMLTACGVNVPMVYALVFTATLAVASLTSTLSTSTPRVCVLSSWRISRMMMQVRRDGMVGVLPKRAARSATVATFASSIGAG